MKETAKKETLFVSFSGGRTSAYMCHWLLENKADKYDFIFVFANTAQEHEKTYEFVNKCDKNMGLNLVWVEAVVNPERGKGCGHKIVNYETASRHGEPFEKMIQKYGIPNADYPHCTRELKLAPVQSYKKSLGFRKKHLMAVGIRSDEVDRMSPTAKEDGIVYPLIQWTQVTLPEVRDFWDQQDYDLEIPEHHGNCLTCWKKSDRKLWTMARHNPEWFYFFDAMERTYGEAGAGDQKRVFFRKYRSAQDILRQSKGSFIEFKENRPQLQYGMFDPIDIEEDCGAGCEIS